jgi:ferredoxin
MAIMINDDCINCEACAVECPTVAIYRPGESWQANGKFSTPLSTEHFFIVMSKCNECSGYKEIKCISICPMDAIKQR